MIALLTDHLWDHLWQSTLFAACVALLTLAFRQNGAHVRYWLWFAASLKFLIPFSVLTTLGRQIEGPLVMPHALTPAFDAATNVAQVIVTPDMTGKLSSAALSTSLTEMLAIVWLCGFTAVILLWAVRWLQVWKLSQIATPVNLETSFPIKTAPTVLEPGVIGIFRPVILLPEGIMERLTLPELQAIIVHECAHVQRKDNLTAAIHMLAQAAFWFHPMVWWIGSNLMAERERACDEVVTKTCEDPENYAEGILKVCKFYAESPLICASGVSAANLSKRIEWIMASHRSKTLGFAKRALVSALTLSLFAVPVLIGWASPKAQAQTKEVQDKLAPSAEVAPRLYKDPVYYDFPRLVVNIDGGDKPVYLKLRVTAEFKCVAPDCKTEIYSFERVLPAIVDGFHEFARGLDREALQGRAGLNLLRKEFLSRIRSAVAPTEVKGVLFKEMLVSDTP